MQRTTHRNLILFWGFFLCLVHSVYAFETPQFSEEEYQFIEEHTTVSLGIDPKFMPFEFIDEQGNHNGIAADLVSLIAERTGLTFSYDPTLTWTETIALVETGNIDVLSAVGYTEERARYLTYLPPYQQFQRAIIVQKTNRSVSSLSDLEGRQVAVQQGSSHEGFITTHPTIIPRFYNTVEEALLAVNRGEEVAFIGNEATSIYLSRSLGLTELRVIPMIENSAQTLHIAVRNDLPLLASILAKAFDSITEAELAQIQDRWIRYETEIDYWPIIRVVIGIAIILFIAFFLSSFWIVRLRKAIREKEEAQRRAEQADKEKSNFLARISHEIRTPLNGIRGMSFLLEKTNPTKTQRRYIQSITNTTHTMQEIINDILEYSRLEENKITFEEVPFHLDDVLENCVSIEQYMIRQKGLDFRIHEKPEIPKRFIGDPTRLSQILINLLNNAIKFTEEGSITLSIDTLHKNKNTYTLLFEVADTGIGMSKEQLDTIFTPFVQANATIHRKYGGSGLGLSIVKELIETMGGILKVESEPNEGTRFTVSLPLLLDTKEREDQKSVDFSSLKALLIIQDRVLYDRLSAQFNEYHIQYEGVTSFNLANRALQGTQAYDLIVFEFAKETVFPLDFIDRINKKESVRPKILALIHDNLSFTDESELPFSCDLIFMLPLITSVLFNGLLQLFGKGASSMQPEHTSIEYEPHTTATVLVVEDNPTNQIIAKELLEQMGCTVYLAANGKEGYEQFLQYEHQIECILMDLHMDIMDGYEATMLIREKNKEVPILVTSADLLSTVLNRCKEIGITDVIGKPYDPKELQRKVQTLAKTYAAMKNHGNSTIDFERGLMQVGGDRTAFAKILDSFINELSTLLSDLVSAKDREDLEEIAELAHRCKGSCGAIGAKQAQKLCGLLQGQHGRADLSMFKETYDELTGVLQQARWYQSL
ncbi:MAG: ATP-binding protein [Sphaerochaetaceae bacterium]